MTEHGRAFVLQRLSDAYDLESLKRVWDSLGTEYAKDPEIRILKDRLKEVMK